MTACTPNLPALITALPGDHTPAPQTEFTLARQVLFLENLSLTGSVRSAAAAGGVSHQTAYRARRGQGDFRLGWDAAMIAARANAEATLASRAIDGVEEKVFYHGEEIATRTRYSDRLLLAHLGRLDKLTQSPRAAAFAEDFDSALVRFGAGETPVPDEGDFSSSGPCNTRSMSNSDSVPAEALDEVNRDVDCADDWADDWDATDIDWEDEAAADAEVTRIEAAMAADRPADAPRLDADDFQVAEIQMQAFVREVPRWWLVVPPAPPRGSDAWCYAATDASAPAPDEPPHACDAERGPRPERAPGDPG